MIRNDIISLSDIQLHIMLNCEMSELKNKRQTLICIPGITGTAKDFSPVLESLDDKWGGLSISMRGRGLSSLPHKGYSIKNHSDDIKKIINQLGIKNHVILGVSFGGIYALHYALNNTANVIGLIIVDHPLYTEKFPDNWSESFEKSPFCSGSSETLLDRIGSETEVVDLTENFTKSNLKTAVFVPKKPDVFSLITNQDEEDFMKNPSCSVINFYESDHFIRNCEPEKYLKNISKFLSTFLT